MNINTINLHKVTQESLSPQEFIKLKPEDKGNIAYTQVIPPRLGQAGFGKIKVHYKRPVYK